MTHVHARLLRLRLPEMIITPLISELMLIQEKIRVRSVLARELGSASEGAWSMTA